MEEDDTRSVLKILEELRGPNRRLSSVFPLSNSQHVEPLTGNMPFDDTLLNTNDFLIRKKRKLPLDDSDVSVGDDSVCPASPWEFRRMKSDLVEAKAEITTLETRITELYNLRKETELLFEREKGSLKQNIERDRNTIIDLKNHIKILRKREEKLKDELVNMVTVTSKEKQLVKTKSSELQTENMNLKHKIAEVEEKNGELCRELNSSKTVVEGLQSELRSVKSECDTLRGQLSDLNALARDYQTEKATLIQAQHTINKLENELNMQADIATLVKSQHAKLVRYADLEKQLNILVKENNKLRDTTSNSIYLEGIVEDLRGRLKSVEEREAELVKLRVDLGVAQSHLSEYTSLAAKVLGANTAAPTQLANYLRQLHSDHLLAKSNQSQLQAKVKSLEELRNSSADECRRLKAEVEKLKQELEQNSVNIKRLKKQNALVTWERNDLRSLVDSCQREVTMTSVSDSSPGMVAQQKVETLEKLVDNYRKRIHQLENDPSLAQGLCTTSGESEVEALKKERSQLLEKIQSMEYEMEHRALKGDFNTQNTKIIHFKLNPMSEAVTKREEELETCKAEILKLRERVRILQDSAEAGAGNITETVESNIDLITSKQIEELREKTKSQEVQNQRLREAFKKTMQEFREAIYTLLGYKINGLPNKMYKLSSLYAESPDHYLTFKMAQNGNMELIESEFSSRWSVRDLIEEHLCRNHSIPAFLSAVTIHLFQKHSDSTLLPDMTSQPNSTQ